MYELLHRGFLIGGIRQFSAYEVFKLAETRLDQFGAVLHSAPERLARL